MRAVAIDFDRREIGERNIAEPRLERPEDVLFRVRQVGVCGTDRELAAFRFGYGPEGHNFLIPGHEAVGEVIETASAAFRVGDIVVPVPAIRRSCEPPCGMCARGRRDLCLTNRCRERGIFGAHGYFTERAVDRAEDLVRVPREHSDFAVLIEPLSVVEKAIAMAMRLHEGEPLRAVVVGAGSIGLLAAGVLRLRGMDVQVVSVEPPGSGRQRLAAAAGAEYGNRADAQADIVIEAAGAPAAVMAAVKALAPVGVLVLLGANESAEPLPLLDLIVGNRVVAGSVNASPQAFADAAHDLPLLPRELLSGMVQYRGFSAFRESFLGDPGEAPKIVHSLD
jgi:threonine dehydrogenase-like Zn-dependent dehydrogenase